MRWRLLCTLQMRPSPPASLLHGSCNYRDLKKERRKAVFRLGGNGTRDSVMPGRGYLLKAVG